MDKEASIQSALSAMRNNRPLRAEETCCCALDALTTCGSLSTHHQLVAR